MTQELTVAKRAEQAFSLETLKPQLLELAKKSERIVAVTNAAGRDECHRAYMVLRDQRVDIEKRGKDARDDAVKFGKAVIAAENDLIACIEGEEKRLKDLRDGWDGERERERQAKIEAEAKRVEGIQTRIAELRNPPVSARDDSDTIAGYIDQLRETEIGSDFAEFVDTARDARDGAVLRLQEMHRTAEAREQATREEVERRERERAELAAAQKRLEEERAALAVQQREAQAKIDEANRLAAEQREREAVERRAREDAERAERDAKEAQARAEREAQERAQHEQNERLAAVRKQEQESEAKRLRDEQARLQAEREALAAQRRDQERAAVEKAIAEATLFQAATDAIWLLSELGQAEHITTKKLQAALARETPLAAAA